MPFECKFKMDREIMIVNIHHRHAEQPTIQHDKFDVPSYINNRATQFPLVEGRNTDGSIGAIAECSVIMSGSSA